MHKKLVHIFLIWDILVTLFSLPEKIYRFILHITILIRIFAFMENEYCTETVSIDFFLFGI